MRALLRRRALYVLLGLAASTSASLAAHAAPHPGEEVPDLGEIRYRDPAERRALWISPSVAGVALPRSLGLFDRTVWTVRSAIAWSLAIERRLAVGGRHALVWYDASNVRLRIHEHTLQISGRPLAPRPRLDNRLFAEVTTHSVENSRVGKQEFRLGGIKDVVVTVGYGMEHDLGRRWQVGWGAAFRYAWVFLDTQRQVRANVRFSFEPAAGHRLSAEGVLYYVHRDPEQAGNPLPRHGAYGQAALQYDWLSEKNVGLWTRARFASSFLSGEAPIYEVREESLNNVYGDLLLGVLVKWE